jgi:hypothetical protein
MGSSSPLFEPAEYHAQAMSIVERLYLVVSDDVDWCGIP